MSVKIRLRRMGAKKPPFTEWSSPIPAIPEMADSSMKSVTIIR